MNKLLLASILLINLTVFAQDDSTDFRYWINTGIGVNSSSTAAFGANYNFSLGELYSQVGYQSIYRYIGEYNYDYSYMEFPLKAVNIGIGDVVIGEYYFVSFMIGPAYVWGTKKELTSRLNIFNHNIAEEVDFSTVGLVFNTQFIFTFIKEMGIGVELYGNINSERSLAEIKLTFHLNNGKFIY
ncbi:MAG TPA: hypothetical protein PL041_07010 [Melioribacteraceae bacterium]|nr:hypothetical protein [Melioribacteraceae bacterium]